MESAKRWAADGTPTYLMKPPLFQLWQQSERVGPRFWWNGGRLIVDGAIFAHAECEQTPEKVATTIKGIMDAYRRRQLDLLVERPCMLATTRPPGTPIFERENSWPEVECRYAYGYDR